MKLESLQQWLGEQLVQNQIIKVVFSKPAGESTASKVTIEPVLIKNELMYQCSAQIGAQVKHENVPADQLSQKIAACFPASFAQLLVRTTVEDRTFYANNDGSLGLSKQKHTQPLEQKMSPQNRQKQYLLKEGTNIPFLVELGVMAPDGKVKAAKYDKFKQINRYLELVADVAHELPTDRRLTIIDFGCGKSYLTFAVHYLFTTLLKREVNIIGLDLKADVIDHCNQVATKLECNGLTFKIGNIAQFEGVDAVDMVISLHACDTATDYALAKAVTWNAQVILAVPCCHKELAQQLHNDNLSPLLKHGILKERFAAELTDALRAELLGTVGYQAQVIEFIDLEHTPKNLLIRAVKKLSQPATHDLERCCQAYSVEPLLMKLLYSK